MDYKFNRNFLYFISLIVVVCFVFAKCNHKTHSSINAYVVENTDGWKKIASEAIDTFNCKEIKLQFLNNPYKFGSENNLAVYINQILIFKGEYADFINLYLPDKVFGDRVLPGITIYDGKNAYNFIHKKSMFLNREDKYLYIVFCPDNELTESCYMFSQKEPIL